MKTHEEALAIFNKFNIQVEEVEPTVYKVINNTEEFNIDELELALKECALLTSTQTRYKKVPAGYSEEYAKIYYILLNYDNLELRWKYEDISRQIRETVVCSFKYNPNHNDTIDTIYTADELGRN